MNGSVELKLRRTVLLMLGNALTKSLGWKMAILGQKIWDWWSVDIIMKGG
jgi:hypothetical protein